jgi:hypothetical protein
MIVVGIVWLKETKEEGKKEGGKKITYSNE